MATRPVAWFHFRQLANVVIPVEHLMTKTKPEWAQGARDKKNAARIEAGLKPRHSLMPWIAVALVGAGVLGWVLMTPTPESAQATTSEAELVKQIRAAETVTIEPMVLRETVKVTGTLVPPSQADVAAQVSARVLTVLVRPGDRVEEGEVLVQLDREALEIQLGQEKATAEATRAQLTSAEQQLQRTTELAAQSLATPAVLEQARSTAENLRGSVAALDEAVRAAELSLANATLRAPMTGIVSSRAVEPGQSVAPGTSLITVVNLDAMEYQASATVSTSALVKPGQAVFLTVSGLEKEAFSGTVSRVNPVAIAGTRTIPIYASIENGEEALRGGMFASGLITVAEKQDALAVPREALREDATGSYLLTLSNGAVARQPVEPGAIWNNGRYLEVSGVAEGDVIVAVPLARLEAGDRYTMAED